MDLNSSKDKTLLKNCMILKLKQLNIDLDNQINNSGSSEKIQDIENDISYYSNIYEILKNDDSETLIATLKDSTEDEKYSKFSNTILLSSPQEVANEYIDLVKSLMLENNVYSDEKFKELQTAFFKGNEELNKGRYEEEYEEEPEEKIDYSTLSMKEKLENLDKLFKASNPKTMSPSDFKAFSTQFSDIVLNLGIEKFQQFFDEKKQEISDMQITYIAEPDQKPIYKTTINLSNGDEQSIEGPASTSGFTANYYQNLCYSYLESNKFANINEDLLNSEIILEKMSTFKDCYTKLEELMQKCKITIANNSIFYSSESEIEPEKEEILEACDSKTTDDELVI